MALRERRADPPPLGCSLWRRRLADFKDLPQGHRAADRKRLPGRALMRRPSPRTPGRASGKLYAALQAYLRLLPAALLNSGDCGRREASTIEGGRDPRHAQLAELPRPQGVHARVARPRLASPASPTPTPPPAPRDAEP